MGPALALHELDSIAAGIAAGDAMVKRSPVQLLIAGSIHPGRYLIAVTGGVAEVEEADHAGRERAGEALIDRVLLADAHPALLAGLAGAEAPPFGEALSVIETRTTACLVEVTDRALKGSNVTLQSIRLGDGLGGKAFCLLTGPLADAEAAHEIACKGLAPGRLFRAELIAQLAGEMAVNLVGSTAFGARVGALEGS